MKAKKTLFTAAILLFLSIMPLSAASKVSDQRQSFIDYALKYRGVPYVFGGISPKGFDCSGFIYYVASTYMAKQLPRTAQAMYDSVELVTPKEREPGDLVFFRTTGTSKISHVGIYLGIYRGNGKFNGKRIFIHAASDGPNTGVIISALDEAFWKNHYAGSGRFLPTTKEYKAGIK